MTGTGDRETMKGPYGVAVDDSLVLAPWRTGF